MANTETVTIESYASIPGATVKELDALSTSRYDEDFARLRRGAEYNAARQIYDCLVENKMIEFNWATDRFTGDRNLTAKLTVITK